MAAFRDEGVELGLGDVAGEEVSSSMGTGRREFDLNPRIGEFFSKLRAGGLTAPEAASPLRCAVAPSFLAPDGGAAVLGWGARDVMGASFEKKPSIYSTFNLPKQIHRIRWSAGRFSIFLRKRLD
jgi:hypothetical protein